MHIGSVSPFAFVVAFWGGVISFLSPCVLPLVPVYLSIVSGLDVTELRDNARAHAVGVLRDTSLFIAGFTSVFVALQLTTTAIGHTIVHNQLLLTRLSGAIVLTLALFMLASLVARAPWLYQETRFHPDLGRFGAATPVVTGIAFGFGWTPCIGPVLGSILTIAANAHRIWAGTALLLTYSLGLGMPFLASGLAMSRLAGTFSWVKRHFTAIVAINSTILALMGVLLVFNRLSWITAQLQDALRAIGLKRFVNLGSIRR